MTDLTRIAPDLNAFTLRFDEGLLDDIRASYRQDILPFITGPANERFLEGGQEFREPIAGSGGRYFVVSYGNNPLLWVSCNTAETHAIYRRFFDQLAIEEAVSRFVDHDRHLVMYCGFLVIGDRAPNPKWHLDYAPGANAYTLITPLFELESGHGHLLYRTSGNEIATYRYALGDAIVFGDHFFHSTQPYDRSGRARVLVSMTFGTDKLKYWPVLEQTVGDQSNYIVLPCGHAAGSCRCLDAGTRSAEAAR